MRIRSHSSRIGTAVLVLLLVVGLTVPLFVAADSKEANEPNDVQEAATSIDGTSIDGELTKQGGTDWYSKEFSEGDTVSFALTKTLWDQGLELSLHAPNGTELDNSSAYQGVGKTELSATAAQSGEYALKVEPISEEVYGVQYTVHAPASEASAKEHPEIESGTQQENESNDNRSKAQPITHEEITSEFSDTDDTDWYTVPVKKGEKVSILITKEKSESDVLASIYNPGNYIVPESDMGQVDIDREDTRGQTVISVEQNGTLNIRMNTKLLGQISPIQYTIQIDKTQQSDSSSDSEDTTATTESDDSKTQTDDTVTQSPDNDTTDASTEDDEEGATSQFGPGFTGPTALVALFVTALFALRRR